MNLEQLPADSRAKLDSLLTAIEQALNAVESPHAHAVSDSSMPDGHGRNDVLQGGSIRAPSKPPFSYDREAISALHRALLQSGSGVLFGIVVLAERPDARAKWRLKSKLISRAEHDSFAKARQPIDVEIERELRELAPAKNWERISFGRDMPNKEPFITRKSSSGLERLAPTSKLLTLLSRTESLYRAADLDLVIAFWTCRPGGLEFREYVE